MVIKPEPAPVFSVTSSLLQRESWAESSGATTAQAARRGQGQEHSSLSPTAQPGI